ncbi:CDP-glycerol glycerophosphotransferase (TagB/SpsB family)/glycosyltransferase involved in cell wall biosynthesis [Streptomyces thermodiastaticus]|uniref:CDP-glycerol glycerophosphotransferase (TagB/SpsB family)/glycosyltransferase involved in cell wall biosynthesis n=1 Tax=Streptomyces thermodiastaticus TaxID=44061 RepID=A0ABU0KFN4_9ACTN|nr:CDP-glycerol glycerophosphotransferase (TagB/SpsB family)/glycosyltransferase involved in cell wall biosynthesis [Streptomyces thermodiastaticus]UVT10050.1 CDP-glycerol glycerophosphotransferase family protein [Streptomyces thermocarboxydus]WSB41745.1 CDP-glycerol glycerophosphotransferase family protein [Streptomyces cellulosae]WTF20748.1 CDP-glycerol glycerophosphotransferase family protein [Streptomyces cellulosae]
MPRFTVVVPVHNVQGYLHACLDSVLSQSYRDLELIAVDDRSPDGCGAILDDYAARDERVRVLHLEENVGLGRARNAGMPHATGDYLLFLDSDDTLTPGALRALADRLDETGDPDVLVFDYARTYWWGGTRRNVLAHVLSEAAGSTFTAAERPEILDLLMVVWNKVYRRDFVEREGFTFPPGYYEDTPWTFPVLLSAERIATLDRICLYYRQRRQGNILSTTSRKHFDVHEQYARVFRFVDARPALGHWRPFLHAKMGEHCLDILSKPDRLPPSDRAEFFRRTAEMFHAHRPPGARVPAELRVLLGSYAGYVLRRRATRTGRELQRRAQQVRAVTAAKAVRARSLPRRPLDPHLAVYSAFSHRGMLGDPAAVYRAARELAPHIRGVWVVADEERAATLPPGTPYVLPDTPEYRRVTGRATYFVNNVNWAGTLVKRQGSVHVHTHHGTPLKYAGADLLEKPGARLHFDVPQMLRRADRWDYGLVANRHSELVWERAFPCHFTSLRSGSPRNDVLVRGDEERARATRERLGIPEGDTVVLYAPTRRDYRRDGLVERIDLARFAADLGEGRTLVVRLHPTLADGPARGLGLSELHRRGVLVDATDEPEVQDVLLAADVLVTDYSSVMFDYALLDRPVVVHADDWDAFRASRGAYLDVTAEAPGHVTRSYRELAWLFASGTWADEESARLRAAFRERFCEYDDGRAAERVVRAVMLGEPLPEPTGDPGLVPAQTAGRDLLTPS